MIGRIRGRDEFIRLGRDGRRVRIDPFWCTHLLDPTVDAARVAFAISRSVGNAVTRNRLRRRMRSILAQIDLPNGLYLFGCRPAASELTYDQMRVVLHKLAAKAS